MRKGYEAVEKNHLAVWYVVRGPRGEVCRRRTYHEALDAVRKLIETQSPYDEIEYEVREVFSVEKPCLPAKARRG